MTLETLSYVIERFYYSGRVKITTKSLERIDFEQYARLALAFVIRELWVRFKKMNGTNAESYFYAKELVYQEFKLQPQNRWGASRVDFGDLTTIDLPENRDILYIYPKNGDCGDITVEPIPLVMPGENVFYKSPNFTGISFAEKRGNGLDMYNMPTCVTSVTVEAVWNFPELDIPSDIAFEVCKYVFQDIFKIKELAVKTIDDFNTNVNENASQPQTVGGTNA